MNIREKDMVFWQTVATDINMEIVNKFYNWAHIKHMYARKQEAIIEVLLREMTTMCRQLKTSQTQVCSTSDQIRVANRLKFNI